MGAGQSDLYKGTYRDKADNIPDSLKGQIKLPDNDAQIKHIFRDEEGHLSDTLENRKMMIDLANDERKFMGKDNRGIEWNTSINADGSQNWVSHRNGVIQDGGRNIVPRIFDEQTGLNRNIKHDMSWRKR